MNVKALEDLYQLLINFPEDRRFDMQTWVGSDYVTTEAEALECGTACCAAGWGLLMLGSWKTLGIRMVQREIVDEQGNYDYDALKRALKINMKKTLYIFDPREYMVDRYGDFPYISPVRVSKRIREVLDA